MNTTENVLYRFWSADGELLYIGITNDPHERFRSHRATKPWWRAVATITLERHPDRTTLAAAEQKAIRDEGPTYNVTHANQSTPQPMRVSKRAPTHISRDASSFIGTIQRPKPHCTLPRLNWPHKCPTCHRIGVIYQDADIRGRPIDDLIRCDHCMNMWLEEEWTALLCGMPI